MDRIGFVGCILLYWLDCTAGSYCISWIGLYHIVSYLAGSGNTGFCALAGYCLDGMDGLDGALVGWGWDRRTLAGAGTGDPPWAPEQERHYWLLRGGDALAGYCLGGMDGTYGTDGLDGELVGRRWDGQTLAGAGPGAPLWAPEQERYCWLLVGGALCEVAAGTNSVSAAKTRNIYVREGK